MSKTIAETMAAKQRDISVAEFFEKNRHLLGFDNKKKALLTVVKEAVDNSLTYDMPILIRQKGIIKLSKIGALIDSRINTDKDKMIILRNGDLEKLRVEDNIEVLAFDRKTLKIDFRKVSTFFRHKVNSKIYRVKLTSGRYVDLTAYHSVFTLNKGQVVSMPTSELKVGMPVIVPRNNWHNSCPISELNLIEELLSLDASLTSKINIYGINTVLDDKTVSEIRRLLPESKHYRTNDFRRFNYLPLNILRKLNIDINKLNDSKIAMSLSRHKIPAVIKLDHNFAELMGLYTAEGSMLKSLTRFHLSFGSHETELIYYACDLFEKVFGFTPKIKKVHQSAYNIIANSTILCFILKYILCVGDAANTKSIPHIIFNLNNSLKHSFLLAYLVGDGYPSKELFYLLKNNLMFSDSTAEKLTCATASFELYIQLQYLLSSLGINYSSGYVQGKERFVNQKLAKFKDNYYIYTYTSNKKSAINFLPVEETIIKTNDPKLKYSISRINQINVHIDSLNKGITQSTLIAHKGIQTFLEGDIGVLRITGIKEIQYDHKWVYDISVPECENFVAGVGAIICHNSLDACEEARILPEINVEIVDMGNDRFRVIVEDNGPGIVKKQIPNIFAKLLYGSKFHTFRQARGQQGIGISAAVLYAQLTTGRPAKITSTISPKDDAHYYELHIDTQNNKPEIIKEEIVKWKKDHGVKIELDIEASYQKGDQSVDAYLKETAIVNPYATVVYTSPKAEQFVFARATDQLPALPREIKPHPYGVEHGIISRMLKNTESRTLQSFLTNEFSRVGSNTAKEICENASLPTNMKPSEMNHHHVEQLMEGIKKTKIIAPPTDCIVPIGDELLEKGLKKEVVAEFYTSVTRSPEIYRGIPFLVEVALAYGGEQAGDQSIKLLRFANKVPLLYQQSACATFKSVVGTNWRSYGLQQSQGSLPVGPMTLIIHIVSVWPPFTSEAKEAIANYPEIIKEIKLALQECGRKLSSYVNKKRRAHAEQERVNIFENYIPEVADALSRITGESKQKIIDNMRKMLAKSKEFIEENKERVVKSDKDDDYNIELKGTAEDE